MMTQAIVRLKRWATPWLFVLPCLIILALAGGYPLGRTIYLSFTDASLIHVDEPVTWIGWINYQYLWDDTEWWQSVRNTLWFTAISVSLETILGLAVALMLHEEFRGRGAMRAAMLVPWAIPTAVAAKMWAWMLNDVYGVVNDLCARLGLNSLFVAMGLVEAPPVAWLAQPQVMMPAVIMVDVWKTTPFMALLLLAGLQCIPRELYEAAAVDGAGPVRRFTSITLPMLIPALLVALIFRTLDALRVFDAIFVLTGTNPETMSMSIYARQQLVDFSDIGYGSAISTGIFLIIAIFTVGYLSVLRTEGDS